MAATLSPVAQRKTFRPDDHPEGGQRGDCVTACLATVLGVPYEEVVNDGYSQSADAVVRRLLPGVCLTYRILGVSNDLDEAIGDHVKWPREGDVFNHGYWLAAVWSHRIPDVEIRGCGCEGKPDCKWCGGDPQSRFLGIQWGLHAVVMNGRNVVWDPHPLRDEAPRPFRVRGQHTFDVFDALRLREAVAT